MEEGFKPFRSKMMIITRNWKKYCSKYFRWTDLMYLFFVGQLLYFYNYHSLCRNWTEHTFQTFLKTYPIKFISELFNGESRKSEVIVIWRLDTHGEISIEAYIHKWNFLRMVADKVDELSLSTQRITIDTKSKLNLLYIYNVIYSSMPRENAWHTRI